MEQPEEKVYKNRMLILFNVVLMTFMATLDSSIVNVALPVMAGKLSVSSEAIAWVVSSYLIVISGTILIFGRLGDIRGKTEIFKFGIILFTFGSLLCAVSGSLSMLIAARAVQAIGAAAAMATNQGIITQVFPANERGRALGIAGSFVAFGTMVGPPLGGFIVDALSWNYIFLINIPVGIFVAVLGMKTLPRTHEIVDEKLDAKGGVFFTLAIVSLFTSLILGGSLGYASPAIICGFAVAAISFVIFLIFEKRQPDPLIQLKIFKNKLFSLSIFCAFTSFTAISISSILLPFYLQSALKLSPSYTGLLMMVSPIVMSVAAPLSGSLSDRIGSEFLTFLGLATASTGLFLMSGLNLNSGLVLLIAFTALMALGTAVFQSPNTSLIMSTVPRNMLGIAGSINALVRNLGMIFGTTLSVTLLYGRMSSLLGYKVSDYVEGRGDAFIYGMKGVYIAAGAVCATGAILTAIRLYSRKKCK